MKEHVIELVMGCLLLFGFFCLSREAAVVSNEWHQEQVIAVDCGHGGIDPGMIGIGEIQEKDFNLAIGLKVKAVLEREGYKVIMTRETDCGLYEESSPNKKAQDMQNRILLLEETKPALTVSIHQNSYEDPQVKGPQVFYYKDSAQGEQLAKILQEKLNQYLEAERPREAKGNTTYYLLKRSSGILNIVECGFLTNPEEARKLAQEEYQQLVAEAIGAGIKEYLRLNSEL